jgi:microcystin-dependent protein
MDGVFKGQIVLFGGGWAPVGWHACDGELLKIHQYAELFSILGTRFGGDGMTTFALPKLANVGDATYIIAMEGVFPDHPR